MPTTNSSSRPKPLVLCILDGWGYREEAKYNAIAAAMKPNFDKLWKECPHTLLEASGEAVGLPKGQMGSSEVGHLTIGAGRTVFQDLQMIDKTIERGELEKKEGLIKFIDALKKSGGAAHILGLVSPGGIHSHITHIIKLVKIVSDQNIPIYLHCFTDGRDTAPTEAKIYLKQLEEATAGCKNVKIATVGGRYYGMDRDNRWERVEEAFHGIQMGHGPRFPSPYEAIDKSYAAGVTDEFIRPVVIGDYKGMKDGDGVLMANFRTDRAREILLALFDPNFKGFPRPVQIKFAAGVGMMKYSDYHSKLIGTIFPIESVKNSFGDYIADKGLKQLRVAETEKYLYTTLFFSGGHETEFKNETRILVPSPKVPTYDMQPEMSAAEITDRVIEQIDKDTFDTVIINYANPDIVGHTGVYDAAVKAVETLDKCLKRLYEAVIAKNGVMIVTADHGNCEVMYDEEKKEPHTTHTTNPVPFILVNYHDKVSLRDGGSLADIAPTMLEILGMEKPVEMTGKSLIKGRG